MLRRGFSIVEVIYAMVIFLIIVLGIVPLVFTSKKAQKVSQEREHAVILGETLINKLGSLDFDNACLKNGVKVNCKNDDCCFDLKGNDNITYSVKQIDSDEKVITVTVKYGKGSKIEFKRVKGDI